MSKRHGEPCTFWRIITGMTPKQQKFVEEYLVDRNATQAAIRAGYILEPCAGAPGYSYVYALIDPTCGQIIYIGKGTGRRYAQHYMEWAAGRISNAAKYGRISAICAAGEKPLAVYLASHLEGDEALRKERAFIGAIGVKNLTNEMSGSKSWAQRKEEEAQAMLGRLKSYEQWRADGRTSEADAVLYLRILSGIAAFALGEVDEIDIYPLRAAR